MCGYIAQLPGRGKCLEQIAEVSIMEGILRFPGKEM
jgi:hypothetical protein